MAHPGVESDCCREGDDFYDVEDLVEHECLTAAAVAEVELWVELPAPTVRGPRPHLWLVLPRSEEHSHETQWSIHAGPKIVF